MAVLRRQTAGKTPPRLLRSDFGARNPGVRLPQKDWLLDEGHRCPKAPYGKCTEDQIGRMMVTPNGECTCFKHAPCPACTDSILQCSACGYEYHGTAEDNQIVASMLRHNNEKLKAPVDFGRFDLYAIYGAPARRPVGTRRMVTDVDSYLEKD